MTTASARMSALRGRRSDFNADKRRKVLELRERGVSVATIAREMGVSRQRVYQLITSIARGDLD